MNKGNSWFIESQSRPLRTARAPTRPSTDATEHRRDRAVVDAAPRVPVPLAPSAAAHAFQLPIRKFVHELTFARFNPPAPQIRREITRGGWRLSKTQVCAHTCVFVLRTPADERVEGRALAAPRHGEACSLSTVPLCGAPIGLMVTSSPSSNSMRSSWNAPSETNWSYSTRRSGRMTSAVERVAMTNAPGI